MDVGCLKVTVGEDYIYGWGGITVTGQAESWHVCDINCKTTLFTAITVSKCIDRHLAWWTTFFISYGNGG